MKRIPLTQGKFALVDDIDFEYLNQFKWYANKGGDTFYAVRDEGKLFKKRIHMHRVIMDTPTEMDVDHRDGNGLNNTRANLRNCTRIENSQNHKKYANNDSGYKGVDWHKGKWRAKITVNKKNIHLGYFSTPEQAAHAYDAAAKKYHGGFANTNF